MENDIKTPILRRFLHQNMDFDSVGSMLGLEYITCSKIKVGRLVRPTFILAYIMRESRTPRGNFAYKKRLIIVFSKISRAIYNCEGGGFPKEKHTLFTCFKKKNVPSVRFFFCWRQPAIGYIFRSGKCLYPKVQKIKKNRL